MLEQFMDVMTPLIMVAMVVIFVMKYIQNYIEKKKKKEKVEKPRNESDRLYIGMKKAAKSTKLLKHTPVKTTGDEQTPGTKIGETAYGVIAGNDEIVMFLRSKWWKVWETPYCLRVEPELVGDLNAGEIIIKGKGLDSLTDRYTYIYPPSHYHENVDVEKVHKRRSDVAALKFMRLLNFDIDEDRSFAVKDAMRGGGKKAMKEVFMPQEPPQEKREKAEKEKERKADEMLEEYEESSQQSGPMQGGTEF